MRPLADIRANGKALAAAATLHAAKTLVWIALFNSSPPHEQRQERAMIEQFQHVFEFTSGVRFNCPLLKNTIGAYIITYTILGVLYYNYNIISPKTLF